MLLVVITFILVAIGVVSYLWGAWKLSRYAARVSGGLGLAVLLLPPVAFWFVFFKLEQEGKEFPTTMWLFGMASTALMLIVFWTPISYTLTGRIAELEAPSGVAEAAVAAHGKKAGDSGIATPSPAAVPTPTPAPTTPATNGTTGGTNGAAGTNNAATNNAAGSTTGTAGAGQ